MNAPRYNPLMPAPASRPSVRTLVLSVLQSFRQGKRFAEELLDDELSRTALEPRDRSLAREITLGAVRHWRTLDAVIFAYSSRPMDGIDPTTLDALRVGIYQVMYLDRIPPHAAVDETVEALRQRGKPEATAFVNGVLRTLLREFGGAVGTAVDRRREVPVGPDKFVRFARPVLLGEGAQYLATAYSYPTELVERWLKAFGRERTQRILVCGNQSPPILLRTNRLKTDRPGLITRLISEGLAAVAGIHPLAVVVDRPGRPLMEIPAFAEGWATVQDATAMSVGDAVAPQPGEKVLDLCASPGGKSTHLAEMMQNQGSVLAVDVSDDKLLPIKENAARLGTTIVTLCRSDKLDAAIKQSGPFDRVLVDVPCSNTGVLARRAEARDRVRVGEMAALNRQQMDLLRLGARLTKPGGLLVYSTCSIEPEENERVVEAALKAQADLQLLDQQTSLPETGVSSREWRDGGFRARLKRGG